jgi:hypothetical protein
LKESKESHPIYIAVDATNLARCKWCGRMEGGQWLLAKSRLYCSKECNYADIAVTLLSIYLLCAAFIPLLMLQRGDHPIAIVLSSLFVIAIGSPIFYMSYLGIKYKSKVPRGSRINEGPSGVDLLKALPSRVSCLKCDANIDVDKVSADMVYACEYCGASGNIEILKRD